MSPRTCSVAIVGAGPAGSWAARLLARHGVPVTIFDGSHPREKPCGGGIPARAWTLVTRELGQFPVEGREISRATFERARGTAGRDGANIAISKRPHHSAPALLIVNRAAFDRSLLDAARDAGAVFVPERVLAVDVGDSSVTVTTHQGRWTADVLIGADGANSLVRRRVAAPFTRRQLSVGAGWYVRGLSSHTVTIRWMTQPPGYVWSFPRHDRLAVGGCAAYTDLCGGVSDLKQEVSTWLRDARILHEHDGPTAPGVSLEPYAWPIPALAALDLDDVPLGGTRWLLVGDAAGLVDPLTGEGIYYALDSGACAAAALLAGRIGAAERYRQAVATRMLPELRRAARARSRFFTPAFSAAFLAGLSSPKIRAIVNDLVAGEQTYAGLKRRLAATGRVDLAVRALAGSVWRARL